MTTIVHTKIYEIRQSSKGWSGIYALYFNKDKAIKECNELNQWAEEAKQKTKFRLYEHTAEDSLIYNTI